MKLGKLSYAALLCTLPAHGDTAAVAPGVRDALTQIDTLPSPSDLNGALGGASDPLDQLLQIANNIGVDFGVRLRALGALPGYCAAAPASCTGTTPVHTALLGFVTQPEPRTATDLLWLRASIEVLGATSAGTPDDVDQLMSLLDSDILDVRATAARALHSVCRSPGDCCGIGAKDELQMRFTTEPIAQVKFDMYNALMDLSQCDD